MSSFGASPTIVSASSPFLNSSSVGMPRIMKRPGTFGFSSTLSLATVARPSYSPASASTVGARRRHGPHHSAQKSTRTMPVLVSTSKLLSVKVLIFSDAIVSPVRSFVHAHVLPRRAIPREVLAHPGDLDTPPQPLVLVKAQRPPQRIKQRLR